MKFVRILKFLQTKVYPVSMGRNYWYVIKVDGEEVWRGKKPKERLIDFKKKNPNKRVSIAWESDDDLVVLLIG